jgi:hypothetical protein
MNIWALEGHRVTVTEETAKYGDEFDQKQVEDNLKVGETYTVEFTIVGGFSTEVKLQELDGILFNSVNFEDVEEQSEEDDMRHPQWDEYN